MVEVARREAPVFFSPAVNAWVITRFADAEAVLRDPARFTSRDILSITDLLSPEVKSLVEGRVPMEGTLSGLDGEVHARLRRVLNHAFTTARIAELEVDVTELVERLVAPLRGQTDAELVADLCYPLPLWTITRLIGIPDDEMPVFRRGVEDWAALTVAYINGVDLELQLAMAERIIGLHDRIEELFDERRATPRSDLLSAIVAREESDALTPREMLSLVPGLFLAGHETIAQALAMGLYHLLERPERWEALVAAPETVESVIEKALRLDGPVFGMWRNAAVDVELGGVTVPAGSRVYVSYWSANLDAERYPDPGGFDPARANRLHLGFGRGIHYCIGAPLARMELRVALTTLARDFPGLRLAPGFAPEYTPHFFLRGIRALPVTLG
ncbi:MAG TPA: cytochrome P450 [Acidimicrobiales bacterium]|nr:cytochrome P450 [Acidimicrobiales bacterium]